MLIPASSAAVNTAAIVQQVRQKSDSATDFTSCPPATTSNPVTTPTAPTANALAAATERVSFASTSIELARTACLKWVVVRANSSRKCIMPGQP
ncbi:hypothetical protein [Hymenobacter frigidus]